MSDEKLIEQKEKQQKNVIVNVLYHFIAGGFWLYAILHLFILDFDRLIVNLLPFEILDAAIKFKFITLAVIASVSWILLGHKKFLKCVMFLLLYPFIVPVWIIFKLFFRNWDSAFLFIMGTFSFLRKIRKNFVMSTVFVLASLFVCLAKNDILINLGVGTITYMLIIHYAHKIRLSVTKNNYADLGKAFDKWRQNRESFCVKEYNEFLKKEDDPSKIKGKRCESLRTILVINAILRFIAIKFQKFRKSHIRTYYFIISLVHTFFISILSFALIYFGISKSVPGSFPNENFSIWHSLYLSINTQVCFDIANIYPISETAMVATVLQKLSAWTFGIIITFIILTVFKERHDEDIKELVVQLNDEAKSLEALILAHYLISFDQAVAEVEEVNKGFNKIFAYLKVN